jgi:ABC-type sugar transport system permease subunit
MGLQLIPVFFIGEVLDMTGRILNPDIEHKKARWGWAFIFPSLVFFSLFNFYPIFNALYTSLFRKKLLSLKPPEFIGFDNYIYLFKSPDFWNSIRATVVFTIGTFIPMVVFSLIYTRRRSQMAGKFCDGSNVNHAGLFLEICRLLYHNISCWLGIYSAKYP